MSVRALVVGGTGGCGFAMASRLAAEATTASVIVSGRHQPASLPSPKMTFRALDASSMRGIKKYTDAFKASEPQKLDYLIMTQGIFTLNGRTETAEGIDRKMALHYYGKQLLVRELLPTLKPDAKVVVLLDSVYGNPSKLNWDDLDLKHSFSLANAGTHCLVLNDAMVQHWATTQDSGSQRHFIHAWPGVVATGVSDQSPFYLRLPMKGLQTVLGVKPEVYGDRFWTGLPPRIEEGNKEGKFMHYIDNKSRPVKGKKVWTEEELRKVTTHTWSLIDSALAMKES